MSIIQRSFQLPSGLTLEIAQGDLAQESLDAIVNAANRHLQHGGGVAGAIVRRGGSVIQQESDAWVREHGPVSFECPAWTSAGSLACRYVIHAVGPVWGEGGEDGKLASAVQGSLDAAAELGLKSLALPAISTGIFGFPRPRAARVILDALRGWDGAHPDASLRLARVVLFEPAAVQDFLDAAEELKL
jgi:O-acetyl-ADP-ribose deacetylase (regulator of RNase III)